MFNELRPECGFLLVALLYDYLDNNDGFGPVSKLKNTYSSTNNAVNDLLKYLKKRDYAKVKNVYLSSGRVQKHHFFNEEFKEKIRSDTLVSKVLHRKKRAIIESILRNDLGDLSKSLRSSNRFFLLILVIHADQMGKVSELSSSKIRRMMGGISSDRFQSQLKKMQSLGIISYYISGMTFKRSLGKVTSTYFLNLMHDCFAEWDSELSTISISNTVIIADSRLFECSEAASLIMYHDAYLRRSNSKDWNRYKAKLTSVYPVLGGISNIVNLDDVHDFFCTKNIHDRFQLLLHDVASEMLIFMWDFLDEGSPKDMDIIFNYINGNERIKHLCSWKATVPSSMQKELQDFNNKTSFQNVLFDLKNKLFSSKLERNDDDLSDDEIALKKYISLVHLIILFALSISIRYRVLLSAILPNYEFSKITIVPTHKVGHICSEYEVRFIPLNKSQRFLKLSLQDMVDGTKGLADKKRKKYCDELILSRFMKVCNMSLFFNNMILKEDNN